jgi:hypothetical protein
MNKEELLELEQMAKEAIILEYMIKNISFDLGLIMEIFCDN